MKLDDPDPEVRESIDEAAALLALKAHDSWPYYSEFLRRIERKVYERLDDDKTPKEWIAGARAVLRMIREGLEITIEYGRQQAIGTSAAQRLGIVESPDVDDRDAFRIESGRGDLS